MREVFSALLTVEAELRLLEQKMSDPELLANSKLYEETMNRYALRSEWFREQGGYEIETRIRSILHGMGFGGYFFRYHMQHIKRWSENAT